MVYFFAYTVTALISAAILNIIYGVILWLKDGKWIKLSIEYWLNFFNYSKEISTGWKGLDIIIFETNAAIPLTILAIIIIFISYAITLD